MIFRRTILLVGLLSAMVAPATAQMTTTASGLQYQIIEPGNNRHPQPGWRVWVEYTGTLDDGTVFASTRETGGIDLWLGCGQLIKGWEEALPMIGEEGRIILIIPPSQGYADMEVPGIPKNSTLHFEIKLVQADSFPAIKPFAVKGVKKQKTQSGITCYCIEQGHGKPAKKGDNVYVNYTGWLPDGTIYTTTRTSGEAQRFTAGMGEAFVGMDSALLMMPEGAKCRFIIPYRLAFGEKGYANRIPPKTDVTLDIEMVRISPEKKITKWDCTGLDTITTASGLRYVVLEPGYGPRIELDNIVTANYSAFYNDTLFDSSVKRESPIRYPVGAGIVIDGWEEATLLMRRGSRFQLFVPSKLAFGSDGPQIGLPANADVIFDVEILDVME
ncbi:MAG: FKBP-type peptidyl-prolyl cis-trans isomerase [Salinivirgaceae bacterium]|nr:FKBP-type peptidyl-prolyl cis-trans isomerase [Salinivirgaceae bacterium]